MKRKIMSHDPLSIAISFILEQAFALCGNPVGAIILLSICVKIILIIPVHISEKFQRKVNEERSIIEPAIAELNKQFSGEELHNKTMETYKQLGISPAYTLKSLLGPAIQIPFFLAAFHVLQKSTIFVGHSFLWMENLAMPDALVTLPFALPWFGSSLNILPFVMTALTIVASRLTEAKGLSLQLLAKQRKSLYLMAGFFLIFLYPYAAAMVIYWTMNNLLAVIQTIIERIISKSKMIR